MSENGKFGFFYHGFSHFGHGAGGSACGGVDIIGHCHVVNPPFIAAAVVLHVTAFCDVSVHS